MTEHDLDLERLVRASLDAHASEVDTTVPVAARARAAAGRRRTSWVAIGAAAAVAAVAVLAVVVSQSEPPSRTAPPAADPASGAPAGWRYEYWHDVRLEVPEYWGWGTVPNAKGLMCGGPGAMRTPADGDLAKPDRAVPYIGRPIALSDVCWGGDIGHYPEAPYVWLSADEPIGTRDFSNGYTQETVPLGGTTVTVGTDDPALRERIISSATVVDGPCAPTLDAPPRVEPVEEGTQGADSLLVCAYRARAGNEIYDLVHADELDAAAAAATEDAITSSPVITGDCLNARGGEWVALTARGDGWERQYSVDLTCPGVTDAYGRMHRLEPAMAEPWAVNGLPASVYGPYGGKGAWFGTYVGPTG